MPQATDAVAKKVAKVAPAKGTTSRGSRDMRSAIIALAKAIKITPTNPSSYQLCRNTLCAWIPVLRERTKPSGFSAKSFACLKSRVDLAPKIHHRAREHGAA